MNSKILSTVALAAAAAVMFSAVAASTARADEGKVKCEGVNSCKGHSACKSANNACKGQNSCKGKGYLEMTKAECDAAKAKAKQVVVWAGRADRPADPLTAHGEAPRA